MTKASASSWAALANRADLLLAFSGGGNSKNIQAPSRYEELCHRGLLGGKAKGLADVPIHFAIDDMQIAEDTQTIICHMIMQWLHAQRDQFASPGSGGPA